LDKKGVYTKCVHSGEKVDELSGSITTPIYQTSTFGFSSTEEVLKAVKGEEGRYLYTRWGNPTQRAVELKLAELEFGEDSALFSSGMAAISTSIICNIKKGEHIVAMSELYGGTLYLLKNVLPSFGVEVTFVEGKDIKEFKDAIKANTRIVIVESPTNPTLKIIDIKELAKVCHESNVLLFVDNTFATPVNQNPLKLCADLVIHSASKYLNGHSDVIAGAVVGNKEIVSKIKSMRKVLGSSLDPHASYLLLRGMKTLAVRVEKQNKNALEIARYLEGNENVNRVYYPGLKNHPKHYIAKRQMRGFGGMLSFEIKGGLKEAKRFVESLNLAILAPSLGGVETLVTQPATTSHSMVPKEERERIGIKDSLIRVSVGIEDAKDIIEDFELGFAKLKGD
jgi:cystathionine gamma-lyase